MRAIALFLKILYTMFKKLKSVVLNKKFLHTQTTGNDMLEDIFMKIKKNITFYEIKFNSLKSLMKSLYENITR